MILTPRNVREVRGIEAEVARLTGDPALARRVRQAAAAGRAIEATLAKAIERALIKRGVKPVDARKLLAQVRGGQGRVVARVTDPATLAQPLIKRGILGWAKVPGKREALLVERGTGCRILDDNGKEVGLKNFSARFPYPHSVDKAAFIDHARRDVVGENAVPYFYLGGDGNVTIGIGHKVPNEPEARRLARTHLFFFAAGALARANESQVAAAYTIVNKALRLKGKLFSAFEPLTLVRLDPFAIEDLFAADVEQFISEIGRASVFPEYPTYPPTAKIAILDMVFNLGLTKFLGSKAAGVGGAVPGFPNFIDAVRKRDWGTAAAESKRGGPNVDRNDRTRLWLLEAARREPFFIAATSRAQCPMLTLAKFLRSPPTP